MVRRFWLLMLLAYILGAYAGRPESDPWYGWVILGGVGLLIGLWSWPIVDAIKRGKIW